MPQPPPTFTAPPPSMLPPPPPFPTGMAPPPLPPQQLTNNMAHEKPEAPLAPPAKKARVEEEDQGKTPVEKSANGDTVVVAVEGLASAEEEKEEEKEPLSEQEFYETVLKNGAVLVHLSVTVPKHDSYADKWELKGQTLELEVDGMTTLGDFKKNHLKPNLGSMPLNKMQLKLDGNFLRSDTLTLAHLNLETTRFELVPKMRGGRK
eukprot:scaffold123546_cov43-Attheya_sp.AAC.1